MLGVGLVGINAGDLITEGVLAIEMGATVPRHGRDDPSASDAERNGDERGRGLLRHGHRDLPSQEPAPNRRDRDRRWPAAAAPAPSGAPRRSWKQRGDKQLALFTDWPQTTIIATDNRRLAGPRVVPAAAGHDQAAARRVRGARSGLRRARTNARLPTILPGSLAHGQC